MSRPERKPVFNSQPDPGEIRSVSDFHTAFWWLYETGIQRGKSTGWRCLDEYYTVRAREWTLITGIPGHGKSTWLDNLMVNLSVKEDWKWAVFSAENWPLERHAATLAAMYIGKPFGEGMRERISQNEFQQAEQFIDQHFKFICPKGEDYSIDRILALAEMVAAHRDPWRSGADGLVIDPWNELDHSRPISMNETEYVSRCLTKIRRFARDHEVHVFLVAHPTKLQRMKGSDGSEASTYPVPTPYDVSGSAHFRNKADACICVWRDVLSERNESDIHIQKIRFREIGRVGVCRLKYDPATGRFTDPRWT